MDCLGKETLDVIDQKLRELPEGYGELMERWVAAIKANSLPDTVRLRLKYGNQIKKVSEIFMWMHKESGIPHERFAEFVEVVISRLKKPGINDFANQ